MRWRLFLASAILAIATYPITWFMTRTIAELDNGLHVQIGNGSIWHFQSRKPITTENGIVVIGLKEAYTEPNPSYHYIDTPNLSIAEVLYYPMFQLEIWWHGCKWSSRNAVRYGKPPNEDEADLKEQKNRLREQLQGLELRERKSTNP